MSTPREWPNVARQARDEAAESLLEAVNQLDPLVMSDRVFTETEKLRRQARALSAVQKALRKLESVGAQTRA